MALLSPESLQRIEREAAKYPPEQRQSAVMSALAIAQDQHHVLTNEVMEEVATVLRMPPVWVYEVATFYNMYNLKPTGKYKVTICTNLPCALSGLGRGGRAPEEAAAASRLRRDLARRAASPVRKASAWAPAATRRC
jgi:NADH:ubiquinone oxidoreductase subunit E